MNTACPSLIDLTATQRTPAVEAHIADCLRCRALLAHLPAAVLEGGAEAEAAAGATGHALADPPGAGQIAALRTPTHDDYLLAAIIEVGRESATVVPLSETVVWATDWDLLLEESLLGYPAMAEVWNHGQVLVEQVAELLGELGAAWEPLLALYGAALDSQEPPTDLPTGPPIVSEEDPRLAFQEEETEAAADFWELASDLARAETLGQLVQLRRPERAPAALDEALLVALEADRLPMAEQLPAAALAQALQDWGLIGSRKLYDLVKRAFIRTTPPQQFAATITFNRRMTGHLPDIEKSREQLAEEYAAEVLARLDAP